ncbi:MAG: aspartate/glutamate racemase family protein [Pseudomonadota bacterium]
MTSTTPSCQEGPQMARIALVHATRVAIAPIEEAAQALWPEAETISILEEGLSVDRQKSAALSSELWARIVAIAKYAATIRPDGILFTCSAFGAAVDDAARQITLPILKPNEAMFDNALSFGERIAMIYTFPPAAQSLTEEFQEAASARGSNATLTPYFSEGALAAKRAGDHCEHDLLLAKTARQIKDADVMILAQFSMSGAADAVRRQTNVPVLTSPEAAVNEMRRRVEAGARQGPC